MSWQIAIILQILISALMTLFTRHLSLSLRKVFYSVGLLSYLAIAVAGSLYAVLLGYTNLSFPPTPVLPYLLIEGLFIPAAWLTQYKLMSYVGASNAVIATTFNTVGAAIAGILFFNEPLTAAFVGGATFIIGGMIIALRIRPDEIHKSNPKVSFAIKFGILALGTLLFAIGMSAEKAAVNHIGVQDYVMFGWGMQGIGALVLFMLFGRRELAHINRQAVRGGIILGLITSLSGLLYIYALSLGSLSHTIVATSGKIAVVMILAAVFLRERNSLWQRIAAFLLATLGLWLILA